MAFEQRLERLKELAMWTCWDEYARQWKGPELEACLISCEVSRPLWLDQNKQAGE